MQRRRQGRPGGGIASQLIGPALLRLFQVEGIVGQHGPVNLERGHDRVRRLSVELAGSGLAPAFLPVPVGKPDPYRAVIALPTPSDHKRVGGAKLEQLDIHPQLMGQGQPHEIKRRRIGL